MKFKYVHFFFENELTEEQEGKFLANLNSLKDEEMAWLKNMYDKLENNLFWKAFGRLPPNKIALDILKITLMRLMTKGNYIRVEKISPKQYRFSYPHDELALISLNLGKQRLRAAKIMNDTMIIQGLKIFVFPEIKISPKDVIIERGEYEEADS